MLSTSTSASGQCVICKRMALVVFQFHKVASVLLNFLYIGTANTEAALRQSNRSTHRDKLHIRLPFHLQHTHTRDQNTLLLIGDILKSTTESEYGQRYDEVNSTTKYFHNFDFGFG